MGNWRTISWLGIMLFIGGCEQWLGKKPTPEELQEEAKAIGGGCRHVGRSLEDCYKRNPEISKAGIYAGWKEMQEYMGQQNISTAPMPAEAQPVAGENAGKSPQDGVSGTPEPQPALDSSANPKH